MARFAIEVPDSAPAKDEPDAMLSRLATRGLDRESALEKKFRDKGLSVVNVQTSLEEQRREPADSELTDATTLHTYANDRRGRRHCRGFS